MIYPESLLVDGGKKLVGQVSIQGSKNATLPILAACILSTGDIRLRNVPDLADVRSMLEILKFLGVKYTFKNNMIDMNCAKVENKFVPMELTEKIRASSLFLGPLTSQFEECQVGMPGGCDIGTRPLDYHINGLQTIGYQVDSTTNHISVKKLKNKQEDGIFQMEKPSVGATENLIMASVFRKGKVTLKNVAIEPEIIQLVHFLNQMGASIYQPNVSTFVIEGVEKLKDRIDYEIQPDRIEAGTFLIAGLATKGSVQVVGVEPEHLGALLYKFAEMGAHIEKGGKSVRVSYAGRLKGVNIKTDVYPGFPTDLQPQMSVLLTQAETGSYVKENIFENRMKHFNELKKMSATLKMEGNQAQIYPSALYGVPVDSYDLRGAAAMIIAALVAKGTTRVRKLNHLFRGYEAFPEKLIHLGANICVF